MGEAKNRERVRRIIDAVTKEWIDQGRIIEAGFRSLLAVAYHEPEKIPPDQLAEMRRVFFAGAQHLWGSVFSAIGDGTEPTEAELRRMTLVDSELQAFVEEQNTAFGFPQEPRGKAQ